MCPLFNKNFDTSGNIASKGVAIKEEINKFLLQDFFNKAPPKSLDRHSFIVPYKELIKKKYSVHDTMATLAEYTCESIAASFKLLPKKVNNILITGGGYKNIHLVNRLKNRLQSDFFDEKQLGLKFDYIESELIAYLSARSINKLPFTFPSTTGVCMESTGGQLYRHL